MKTKLYCDCRTQDIRTAKEVMDEYREINNSELPMTSDVEQLILVCQLSKNGGNYELLDDSNAIVKWCNDYADYRESDRHYSQEERDENIRDYYECIYCRGDYVENISESIRMDARDGNEDAIELVKRLVALL